MSFVLRPPQIAPFRLHNRRVAGTYRVFDVIHQDVLDGEGRARRDVFTFTCPDWCNVVARTPAGELVLIWQFRFGTDALELEVPGGVIEAGEAPEAAALRELREETGYVPTRLESLGKVAPNPALQGNFCHFFLAHDVERTASTSFDEHEEIEITLVPEASALSLLDQGEVRHSLAIIALERALHRLGVRR